MADLFFRAVVLVSDGLLVVRPTGHVHQLTNALFLELQDQVRAMRPQRIKIRQQKGSDNVQVSLGGIR